MYPNDDRVYGMGTPSFNFLIFTLINPIDNFLSNRKGITKYNISIRWKI